MAPPPMTNAPGLNYVGPTQNITVVANAIAVYDKSLTILVTVRPGLALTHPVTISIAYLSPAGYGPGSPERLTQGYVASSGNHFLRLDAEGDGKPRRVHLDITLTEPKPGGGVYSYNVPMDMDLDPLYDVKIDPVTFTLLNDCSALGFGHTTIEFGWLPPDGKDSFGMQHLNFTIYAGKSNTIFESAWARAEVSASVNLHTPLFAFTDFGRDLTVLQFLPQPGVDPSQAVNLVPGQSKTITGNLKSQTDANCTANFQYTITYNLRWYPYL